jgi:hypothetical protein
MRVGSMQERASENSRPIQQGSQRLSTTGLQRNWILCFEMLKRLQERLMRGFGVGFADTPDVWKRSELATQKAGFALTCFTSEIDPAPSGSACFTTDLSSASI